MKNIVVLATFLLLAPSAWATTYHAANCSQSAVQSAIDLAVNHGDSVDISAVSPATYTTYLRIQKNITVDFTACQITDNVTKNGDYASGIIWATVSDNANLLRITNFTLLPQATDPNSNNKGEIVIDGTSGAQANARVDHVTASSGLYTSLVRLYGSVFGVLDHCSFTNASALQGNHRGYGSSDQGDGSWAAITEMGTYKAFYIESNTFTGTGNPFWLAAWDGLGGGRVVFRFNDLTQANSTSHGTDTGQRERGIRQVEIYANDYSFPANAAVDFIHWFRGGTGVMALNTGTICPSGCSGGGWWNSIAKHSNYRDSTDVTGWRLCDGNQVWDGNQGGQTGYRCVDQPGAGQSDDLLGSASYPSGMVNNALEPIYTVGNRFNFKGTPNVLYGEAEPADEGHVHNNRDIYYESASCTGAACASGVGYGTSLPTACTTGTGYFKTNEGSWNDGSNDNYTGQGRLYKCTSTNTWTLYWTPYAYPHPLSGNPPVILSATPSSGIQGVSGLQVVVAGAQTSWMNGTTVASLGTGVTVTATACSTTTDCTVTLSIDANATLGGRTLTMTTNAEVETLTNGFTVTTSAIPPNAAGVRVLIRAH